MTYTRAVERYRDKVGADFIWPDHARSSEVNGRWHLVDASGRPVAIVARDGRVFHSGIRLTSDPLGDFE
jgi:hypothetical protein